MIFDRRMMLAHYQVCSNARRETDVLHLSWGLSFAACMHLKFVLIRSFRASLSLDIVSALHFTCVQAVSKPTFTRCVHLFCLDCLLMHVKASRHLQQQYSHNDGNGETPCPCCRQPFTVSSLLQVLPETEVKKKIKDVEKAAACTEAPENYAAVPLDAPPLWSPVATEDQLEQLSLLTPVSRFGYNSQYQSLPPILLTNFLNACGIPPGSSLNEQLPPGPLRASPKMTMLLQILLSSKLEAKARGAAYADKVVVFSQHRSAVLHCAAVLKENGVRCVYIVPGDTQANQSNAIDVFHQDPSCQVFVLHAGRYTIPNAPMIR